RRGQRRFPRHGGGRGHPERHRLTRHGLDQVPARGGYLAPAAPGRNTRHIASPHALTVAGITGHTGIVKTAISLPDDLFHEVEACARRLKVSRSRFFVVAARDFLSREHAPADATAAWNAAIAQA